MQDYSNSTITTITNSVKEAKTVEYDPKTESRSKSETLADQVRKILNKGKEPESTPTAPLTDWRKDLFNKQFTFSGKGHQQAIETVYNKFFGECKIFDATGSTSYLDTKIGVDYIVSKQHPKLRTEVDFWVQERFRKAAFQHYQSITLIEYNQHSDHLSEVYKTKAQFLVYGYLADDAGNTLTQCVVIDLPSALQMMLTDTLPFEIKTNNNTNQRFLSCDIADLREKGLVRFEYNLNS